MPDRTSRPSRPRRHRRLAAAALASATLLAAPAAAHAAGWIEGPEFSPGPWSMAADLAGAPDGSTTLAWVEAAPDMRNPAESPAPQVKVQRAAVDGTVGPVFDVAATEEGFLQPGAPLDLPVVATGAGGATAVAWTFTPDTGSPQVKLAFAGASGEPGQVVTLGDAVAGIQFLGGSPLSLGIDGGGAATVVWEGPDPRRGGDPALFAAHVFPDGTVTTTLVAPLSGTRTNPQVAVAPSGVAWVAWGVPDDGGQHPDDGAQVARLAADGTVDGAAQPIGARTTGAVVSAGAGGAVAAATDPRTGELFGVRLAATGPLLGTGFQVASSAPAPDPRLEMNALATPPALVLGPDGTVTIARTVGEIADITAVRFEYVRIPPEATTGSPQPLAEPPAGGIAWAPALASTPDGTVLATWVQTRRGIGVVPPVFARIVAPDGSLGPNLSVGAQAMLLAGAPGAAASPLLPTISDAGAAMIGVPEGLASGTPLPIGGFETRVLDARAPVVGVNVPATAVAGAQVAFSATATDPAGVQLLWDFGDDSGSTRASVSHRYAAAGSYTVTLTATDGAGNQTVLTRKLTVTSRPAPKRTAALKVGRAFRRGARVTVNGTIAARAGGTLTIVYSQRTGHRTFMVTKTASIARGHWGATLTLTGRLAHTTGRAKVTASYAGDAGTRRAAATRAVTQAKPKPKPKKPAKKPAKKPKKKLKHRR